MGLKPVKSKCTGFDSGVYEYRPETVNNRRDRIQSDSFNNTQVTDFKRADEVKFMSSTTVPSTDEEKSSTLTVTELKNKIRKPLLHKKRLIFKNKRKKDIKKEFCELLAEDETVNEILQAKINYFYKPYSNENNFERSPPMNFQNEQGQSPNEEKFHEQADNENWKKLCKTVLSKDGKDLRQFLLSINPTMYCRLKNLGQQYYMNEFMKNSESESKNPTNKDSNKNSDNDPDKSVGNYDPVTDGISILKNLILDKIACKIDEKDNKHFESTYNPKIESLSAPLPPKRRRRKKCKVKSKVSWKNAETLIPCQYASVSTKQINTNKLYSSMVKEWQNKDSFKLLAGGSSKGINFNRSIKGNKNLQKGILPILREKCKKVNRLRLSTEDLKSSTMNSEKFIIEMQKRKDFERLDKYRTDSLTRPVQQFGSITTNTLKENSKANTRFLKPVNAPKRVKILTPLCLNTSMSSALSVSACSDNES